MANQIIDRRTVAIPGPAGDDGVDGAKGDKGDTGERGPQGLPGVNAVPADDAVASYVGTDGTETQSALDARYVAVAEADAVTAGLIQGGSVTRDRLVETIEMGANLGRVLTSLRAGKDQVWGVIGDSKSDPTTPGNSAGGPIEKAAALVASQFGVTIDVVNGAKSGHTAARQFLEGRVQIVVDAEPDLVFINLGTNDSNADENGAFAAGYPVAASIAAIERAAAYVRDANPAAEFCILGTSPYAPLSNPSNEKIKAYNRRVNELAATLGAEYVDLYSAFAEHPDFAALMYDSTHPGTLGNDLTAATIQQHFPEATQRTTPALAERPARGLTGIDRVRKAVGNFGYAQVSASGTNDDVSMSFEGTGWSTVDSFDVSSTPGDSVSVTGNVMELLINIDLSAEASPVADFYLDGTIQAEDVDLHAQSAKNSTNYWLAPFVELAPGEHTMKVVVKSGTLRVQAAAGLRSAQDASDFRPEMRIVDFGSNVGSEPIDSTGGFTSHLSAVLQLPNGWNAMLVQFMGYIQLRTLPTTTSVREYQCQIMLGSTSLYQPQMSHPATTAQFYTSVRMDTAVEVQTPNSQGVYMRTRLLSDDKSNGTVTGWGLKAVLTRTA